MLRAKDDFLTYGFIYAVAREGNGRMPEPEVPTRIAFEAWDDPEVDTLGVAVDGDYSRNAWRPVLGNTTWLVWASAAARLDGRARVDCALGELAPAWVPEPSVVAWSLDRLEAFGLVAVDGDARLVRRACPPLVERQLARTPSTVRALHDATFPVAVRAAS
jgi:hypothetical protein